MLTEQGLPRGHLVSLRDEQLQGVLNTFRFSFSFHLHSSLGGSMIQEVGSIKQITPDKEVRGFTLQDTCKFKEMTGQIH